jgi:hypothetical protein
MSMHIIPKELLEPSLQLVDYQFSGNVSPQPMDYGDSDTSSADKSGEGDGDANGEPEG